SHDEPSGREQIAQALPHRIVIIDDEDLSLALVSGRLRAADGMSFRRLHISPCFASVAQEEASATPHLPSSGDPSVPFYAGSHGRNAVVLSNILSPQIPPLCAPTSPFTMNNPNPRPSLCPVSAARLR